MLLSIALEAPIAVGLCRALGWTRDFRRLLLVAVAATLLTHPFAYEAMRSAESVPFGLRFLALETAIAAAESAMYAWVAGLGAARGTVVGFVANAFSAAVGVLLLWR
jgi:hypothetical protein